MIRSEVNVCGECFVHFNLKHFRFISLEILIDIPRGFFSDVSFSFWNWLEREDRGRVCRREVLRYSSQKTSNENYEKVNWINFHPQPHRAINFAMMSIFLCGKLWGIPFVKSRQSYWDIWLFGKYLQQLKCHINFGLDICKVSLLLPNLPGWLHRVFYIKGQLNNFTHHPNVFAIFFSLVLEEMFLKIFLEEDLKRSSSSASFFFAVFFFAEVNIQEKWRVKMRV